MNTPENFPLGVVVYEHGFDIVPVLGAVVADLEAKGTIRVGGVLPRWGGYHANERREMLLAEIGSGKVTQISQELGAGADSCILDLDGLTRARAAIGAAIERGVDVLFVGKFAKQEAAGAGVREEIAEAVAAGIPTVVAMRTMQLEAWTAFAGDEWTCLEPTVEAIAAWAGAVSGK